VGYDKKVNQKAKAVFNWRTGQHSVKRYKLARQMVCLSVLFLGSVWLLDITYNLLYFWVIMALPTTRLYIWEHSTRMNAVVY
jgi:hypothetical protein